MKTSKKLPRFAALGTLVRDYLIPIDNFYERRKSDRQLFAIAMANAPGPVKESILANISDSIAKLRYRSGVPP